MAKEKKINQRFRMNLHFTSLPKEVSLQILDQIDDPSCMALVCKEFCSWSAELFKLLFERMQLPLHGEQHLLDNNNYYCGIKSLLLTAKALHFEGGHLFLKRVDQNYAKREISFVDSVQAVHNWVGLRTHFNNQELHVVQTLSSELALADCAHLNPLNYTIHATDYCKVIGRFERSLALVLKASTDISGGDLALNSLQRHSLFTAINECVRIEILNRDTIPQAKKAVLLVRARRRSAIFTNTQIATAFLDKFHGHLLNNCHTIPLRINSTTFNIEIRDLESNDQPCDFAILNSNDVSLSVIMGD
jgi:hypothetical protein